MNLLNLALPWAFTLLAIITAALAALYFDLPGRLDRILGWIWAVISGVLLGCAVGLFIIGKVCA